MPRRSRLAVLKHTPLRIQLTAAFASVMAIVLATTGVLIFTKFSSDFDVRTDRELEEREATIERLAHEGRTPASVIALAGEAYVQVYGIDGDVLASSRLLTSGRLLSREVVAQAHEAPVVGEHRVPNTDDGARVRAFAIDGDRVAAIGEPLEERAQELRGLALLLGLSLPAALLLASIAGYLVARSALRPVEAMRLQAEQIGEGDLDQRLPVPGTRDELDRLATTMNDLLDRLAAALERERRMVGDASHELRTPISILRTRIDVALRAGQTPAELRTALTAAGKDARRLSRLADDLMLLARADQGRLPLRPQPLDVQDAIEQSIDRVVAAGIAAAGEVTVGELVDGGAVVWADPDRTAQALDNLVANALLHGSAPVVVSASVDGAEAAIQVRDHGAGFPEELLPHALERFSQANVAGTGTGLGLAIADAVTRGQGGKLRVANHPDGGAVATLRLPLA